jgi:hypothetical protein
MANKRKTTQKQSPIGPSLPPEHAVQLLIKQRDKGKHLLENRPIRRGWRDAHKIITFS